MTQFHSEEEMRRQYISVYVSPFKTTYWHKVVYELHHKMKWEHNIYLYMFLSLKQHTDTKWYVNGAIKWNDNTIYICICFSL